MGTSERIHKYFDQPHLLWLDSQSVREHDRKEPQEHQERPLLIFLHGYGATEEDIALSYQGFSSGFAAVAVRAPLPIDNGYMWFPVDIGTGFTADSYDIMHAHETTIGLLNWIRSIGGAYTSVTLLGFSMGMVMATNLLRYAPTEFAAVVGLSGLVLKVERQTLPQEVEKAYGDERLKSLKIPFFWGHDRKDPMVPETATSFTQQWLKDHVMVNEHAYEGIGHSISGEELTQASEFLNIYVL